MERGICGLCSGPVTKVRSRGRHGKDFWVHDHAQMSNGKDVDHEVIVVHGITAA